MTEPSLYERLGGAFAIAAVVDHFSNQLVLNPIIRQRRKTPPCESGTGTTTMASGP